jgi:hypothetical protein
MIELLLEAERALSVGMLDQAERLYRQVAAADTRNAIALVGLARIAIERDDEDAALSLGGQALEIDPDNGAARRLVDRLTEVRAHRGIGAYIPPSQGTAAPVSRDRAPVSKDAAPVSEDATPVSPRAPTAEPPAAALETPPGDPVPASRPGLLRRILGRR